jgi:hypothetical protein
MMETMKLKGNLPLQCFLIGMLILVIFIGRDICQNAITRAGSLELAFMTMTGTLPRYYQIENVNSLKIVDVYNGDTSNGAGIIQWVNKNGPNQLWQLIETGSGYYKIRNQNSGKLLDVRDGSTADGAPIVQFSDNGGDSQFWLKIDAGTGKYKFKNKKSGKLLDVNQASKEDGAGIIQGSDNNRTSQLWRIN